MDKRSRVLIIALAMLVSCLGLAGCTESGSEEADRMYKAEGECRRINLVPRIAATWDGHRNQYWVVCDEPSLPRELLLLDESKEVEAIASCLESDMDVRLEPISKKKPWRVVCLP